MAAEPTPPPSGDTTPCKVTPIILHGGVSPDDFTQSPEPSPTFSGTTSDLSGNHPGPASGSGCEDRGNGSNVIPRRALPTRGPHTDGPASGRDGPASGGNSPASGEGSARLQGHPATIDSSLGRERLGTIDVYGGRVSLEPPEAQTLGRPDAPVSPEAQTLTAQTPHVRGGERQQVTSPSTPHMRGRRHPDVPLLEGRPFEDGEDAGKWGVLDGTGFQ